MKINFQTSLPIAVLTAMLCAPTPASAQTILLSSGNFVVLGQTTVTNDNTTTSSVISGNVGLSPGTSVTGFQATDGGSAVVTNGVISINNGVAAQAVADAATAYTALAAMPTGVGDNFSALGTETLSPGVYTSASAVLEAASTTLTLNANFQNNAVWVFQIGGALTIGGGVQIIIENPGSNPASDGVFWDVASSVTVGLDDMILGNYLAGTGSITLGAGMTGSSRFLAHAAVSLVPAGSALSISSTAGNGNSYDGGLKYAGPGNTNLVVIPEPAAFLWLAPLGAMGLVLWRRKLAIKRVVA